MLHAQLSGVVLVPNLADELLDEVLQRHDAGRAAVLVDHQREVPPFLLHLEEQRVDLARFRHDEHRTDQGAVELALVRLRGHAQQVLGVEEPGDVIDVREEQRDARVAALRHHALELGGCGRHRGGGDVGARHHGGARIGVPESDRAR
jgi:hypothetical protein